MELTPGTVTARYPNALSAECRCPPGTAQHHDTTSCYKLYEQGPCDIGQYFAPINEPKNPAIMYVLNTPLQTNLSQMPRTFTHGQCL